MAKILVVRRRLDDVRLERLQVFYDRRFGKQEQIESGGGYCRAQNGSGNDLDDIFHIRICF